MRSQIGPTDTAATGYSLLDQMGNKSEMAAQDRELRMQNMQKLTAIGMSNLGGEDKTRGPQRDSDSRKIVENDMSRKVMDDLHLKLRHFEVHIEQLEAKGKATDKHLLELREKTDTHCKHLEMLMLEKIDKLGGRIKAEENNRLLLSQEFQMALNQREKIICQKIQYEAQEEFTARQAVVHDVSRLYEMHKDLKIYAQDECTKVAAAVSALQAKTTSSFAEVTDSLNAERVARERALSAARNDLIQKHSELRNFADSKYQELKKEANESVGQLSYLCDTLRQDAEKSNATRDKLIEVLEDKATKLIEANRMDLVNTIRLEKNEVENKTRKISRDMQELYDNLQVEVTNRQKEYANLQDALAEEHFRRTQDESKIINSMEEFVKQIKEVTSTARKMR